MLFPTKARAFPLYDVPGAMGPSVSHWVTDTTPSWAARVSRRTDASPPSDRRSIPSNSRGRVYASTSMCLSWATTTGGVIGCAEVRFCNVAPTSNARLGVTPLRSITNSTTVRSQPKIAPKSPMTWMPGWG